MNDLVTDLPVAYLGPKGTFSQSALHRYFGDEQAGLPVATIQDVFTSVETGKCDYGVVPVENSSEGSVTATLDCLKESAVLICGEISLRIQHLLLTQPGTESGDIDKVYSHQQSLGQCRQWLDQHLPGVSRIPVSSNAEAAAMSSREKGTAAIASQAAAKNFKLTVLAENIADSAENTTRFLIISKKKQARLASNDQLLHEAGSFSTKTSLIITTQNEPGALLAVLEPLKRHEVNMSKLESRPSGQEVWSYTFYIDIDGHQLDNNVSLALEKLQQLNIQLKISGSYQSSGFIHTEEPRALLEPVLAGKKIVFIGLGLIGGSIARGLADKGLSSQLFAVGKDQAGMQLAKDHNVIADFSTKLESFCGDADLVVIAVPGLSVEKVMRDLAGLISKECVITDVASVKQTTINAAHSAFGEMPANLVPGHPIAGGEKSGFIAAQPDLFVDRKIILTPQDSTNTEATALVRSMWQELGARIEEMSVERHDAVLAATSHLPHLLAFALVDSLSQQGSSDEIFKYAAGGFRDFTRIAASDPEMWRDIFLSNTELLCQILEEFETDLVRFKQVIKAADSEQIMQILRRVKQSRENFSF